VRKASCKTLQKNIDVGGLFSLDIAGQIDLRTQVELQINGLRSLQNQLDNVIEETLGKDLKLELATPNSRAYFVTPRKNLIRGGARKVIDIIGSNVFMDFGKTEITLAMFEKLLKSEGIITDEQKAELRELKYKEYGDPSLRYENTRSDEQSAILAPDVTKALAPAAPLEPIVGLD
jgi:hypothetical protein